jgi:hypothetical protein
LLEPELGRLTEELLDLAELLSEPEFERVTVECPPEELPELDDLSLDPEFERSLEELSDPEVLSFEPALERVTVERPELERPLLEEFPVDPEPGRLTADLPPEEPPEPEFAWVDLFTLPEDGLLPLVISLRPVLSRVEGVVAFPLRRVVSLLPELVISRRSRPVVTDSLLVVVLLFPRVLTAVPRSAILSRSLSRLMAAVLIFPEASSRLRSMVPTRCPGRLASSIRSLRFIPRLAGRYCPRFTNGRRS